MDRKRQIRKLSKESDLLIKKMIDETKDKTRKDALIKCSVIAKSISLVTKDLIDIPIVLK